jgi:hypothetical protein
LGEELKPTDTLGCSTAVSANEYTKNLEIIYQQYPGVPAPYPLTWDRNDTELPLDDEWQHMLQATATALHRAVDVCNQLADRSERTTRNGLIHNKNALLCAIHKAEDLVAKLSTLYPLPTLSNYRIARSNLDLAPRTPALLHNGAERILIWLPRLPSKKRGTNSLLFQELQELLAESDLPHLDKWHCDFIHIYHPNNLTGILDVDNYDYKPVIDALTLALTTQDSFDHFSLSMYNLPHTELNPGCYIHISKRNEKVGFFQDFIKFVQASQQG